MNDAVAASIADGVTYVVSAGNDNRTACGSSPASVPDAITVGATADTDARTSYSNYGTCEAIDGVVTDPGPASPNKLLHIGAVDPPSQFFTVSVDAPGDSLAQGGSVTATIHHDRRPADRHADRHRVGT